MALAGGALLFALMQIVNPWSLDPKACTVAAIAALMVFWWISEAMPMPMVALIPLVLFPLLGIAKLDDTAAPYASPIIFLFMGGFMLGLAIEKWNLHKRIALNIVKVTGTSGNRIVLGFIIATGFLSMWLSNTATTMMMYPIAMSVVHVLEEKHNAGEQVNNLGICLMLSIAYASNLGGLGTIIGTPPNVAWVAYLEKQQGYVFPFVDWMIICTPLSIILSAAIYFVTAKWLYPTNISASATANEMIDAELKEMGKMTKPEKRVLYIFVFTATLWVIKDVINGYQTLFKLDDTIIAIAGASMLFMAPANDNERLLEWPDTQKMAWGILLLFGGGIALAQQLEHAGLIEKLGQWISSYATNGFMLVLIITLLSIFISEVMSNVAQVIVFAPVVAGIAEALHTNGLQLGLAMTLGASCASMLPMGTPPNAIVFASGKLKLKHMLVSGFILNIISAIVITLFCWYVLPAVLPAAR